ncbi:MAG: N-acetylmuramoyl-L-alanine amidase LytC [candidate division WS2 bacterium]|nr:N-acetylmuramoyl-L-alanine amidase LytC [Candidatus Psychracetigena formicireducens]
MTRSTDVTLPLRQRLPVAGNSLFVSIHANAFHLRSANGTETFFNSRNPQSKILADIMQKNLVSHLNLRNRGVKWADFTVLTQTSIPAVLVELAFISNLEEERLMGTSAFQHSAAQGIASGILEYLEFIS